MRKLLFAFVAIAAISLTSCNKDQSAVKKLDGNWKSVKMDGETLEASEQATYNFMSCKLKSDEFCDASVTYADNSTENFEYSVTGKGTVITWKTDDGQGNSFSIPGTIDELSSDKLVITFTFIGSTTTEFEKI